MNIMQDPKLFVLAEDLNEKINKALKSFGSSISTNVKQHEDYYAFEFYTADLKKQMVLKEDPLKYLKKFL